MLVIPGKWSFIVTKSWLKDQTTLFRFREITLTNKDFVKSFDDSNTNSS